MFIRSERLFLRPGWPEDRRELFERIADEGVIRNLARAPWPFREEDAQQFLGGPRDPRQPMFVVTLPGACGAELVGSAGLHDGDDGRPEIDYWIARRFWGQGYATEASRALLRVAQALGHREITGYHFADNPASGRVLEKLGFRRTGKDRPRFSLGRGSAVPSIGWAIALEPGLGGDDDGDGPMRLAA